MDPHTLMVTVGNLWAGSVIGFGIGVLVGVVLATKSNHSTQAHEELAKTHATTVETLRSCVELLQETTDYQGAAASTDSDDDDDDDDASSAGGDSELLDTLGDAADAGDIDGEVALPRLQAMRDEAADCGSVSPSTSTAAVMTGVDDRASEAAGASTAADRAADDADAAADGETDNDADAAADGKADDGQDVETF